MAGSISAPASHPHCVFSSRWGLQTEDRGVSVGTAAAGVGSQHVASAAARGGADGAAHAQFGGGLGLGFWFWGVFIGGCGLCFPVSVGVLTRSLGLALLLPPLQPAASNITGPASGTHINAPSDRRHDLDAVV